MKLPRIRLGSLLILVLVLAVAIGWARTTLLTRQSSVGLDAPAFDGGLLSMAIFLAFYAVATRRISPFLVGGLLAMSGFWFVATFRGDWVRWYANPIVWSTASFLGVDRHGAPIIYLMDLIVFLPPQLLIALAVALVAGRFRLGTDTIEGDGIHEDQDPG